MKNGKSAFSRLTIVFIVLLLAGLGATPFLYHRSRGHEVKAVKVKRSPLTQTVITTGRVSELSRVAIASVSMGTVAAVLAEEGDGVKAGQLLARLDDTMQMARIRQAEAQLAQAVAAREQAEKSAARVAVRISELDRLSGPVSDKAVAIAESNVSQAKLAKQRADALYAKDYITRAELDQANYALEVALERLEQERISSSAKKAEGVSREEAKAAHQEAQSGEATAARAVETARTSLALARAALKDLELRSPTAGIVIERLVEPGDVAQPGKPLFTLSIPGRTEILAHMDEKNLGLLKVGQKALISADAYPGHSFPAVVSMIVPAISAATGTFTAKFSVAEPPSYLLPDMTVSAEIEIAKKESALTLAAEAVRDLALKTPWVLVVKDGRAARVEPKLGVRGEERVEVAEGLSEGELVILPDGETVAGEKVRVAPDAL